MHNIFYIFVKILNNVTDGTIDGAVDSAMEDQAEVNGVWLKIQKPIFCIFGLDGFFIIKIIY